MDDLVLTVGAGRERSRAANMATALNAVFVNFKAVATKQEALVSAQETASQKMLVWAQGKVVFLFSDADEARPWTLMHLPASVLACLPPTHA